MIKSCLHTVQMLSLLPRCCAGVVMISQLHTPQLNAAKKNKKQWRKKSRVNQKCLFTIGRVKRCSLSNKNTKKNPVISEPILTKVICINDQVMILLWLRAKLSGGCKPTAGFGCAVFNRDLDPFNSLSSVALPKRKSMGVTKQSSKHWHIKVTFPPKLKV